MASGKPAEMTLNEEQVAIQQDYDEYPYESFPFSLSHPDKLSVLATLFGVQTANLEGCRVLELGCASGGNLIPMAAQLPKSQFFGIDLSSKQVERANNQIKELKLKNIKIEHKNILELDGKIRKFDFIICHGVYSWVPADVQQKIMKVCKQYLNENGVVYISYNTYPGWHMRESVRNMMRFHTANFEKPQDKINQSRALLKFMVDSVPTENNPYGQYLKAELDILSKTGDAYLAHEHLERNNRPLYFYEFCQAAENEGLQYLAEAEIHTMLASNFPTEVAETLVKVGSNIVQQEQYMDFLRNRTFRSTLLCHADVKLDRNVGPARLKKLHVSALPMHIVDDENKDNAEERSYLSQTGMRIKIGNNLTRLAYDMLCKQWPSTKPFSELCSEAVSAAGLSGAEHEDTLASDLLKLYSAKAIELHSLPSTFVLSPGERPVISPLARIQAKEGYAITNLRHEVANINEPTRQLLLLLDGQSTQAEIQEKVLAMVSKGELILREGEIEITDQAKQKEYIQQFMVNILQELGRRALLAG